MHNGANGGGAAQGDGGAGGQGAAAGAQVGAGGEGGDPQNARAVIAAAAQVGTGGEGGDGGAAAAAKGDVKAAADAPLDWAKDIPDNLRGENELDTLNKVNTAYLGLRKKLSEGAPDIPDSPEGYEVKMPEKYTEIFGEAADDPTITAVKEFAHKNGVAPDVLQGMVEAYTNSALEAGAFEKPLSLDDYYEGLGGKEEGGKIVGDVAAFANNLLSVGAFGDVSTPAGKEKAEAMRETMLDLVADKPEYALLINAIRNQQREPGMTLPGGGDTGGFELTMDNVRKLAADPRYDSNSAKFDKAYRTKVDGYYAELDKK